MRPISQKHFFGVHKIGMMMVLQLNKLKKKLKQLFIQYEKPLNR
jgi:hypothetical protein